MATMWQFHLQCGTIQRDSNYRPGHVVVFREFSTDILVRLPPELFTQVLPSVTLLSEAKVTLHLFYCLSHQRGTPRRISWDELLQDTILCQSLRTISPVRPIDELLEEGLDAAVRRGTLLHLAMPGESRLRNWYLMHTEANRAWVEQMRVTPLPLPPNETQMPQRSSLVALYEQNIGIVTPLLLEELREAEERYPADWIETAMREAIRSNVRSWRYIRKILERWAIHGRHDATDRMERPIDIDKYTGGAFGDLFRRGGDESGL